MHGVSAPSGRGLMIRLQRAGATPCSSQQYAELAELAGGFIHEIKNHLSTLGLNLQLLAEDFDEPQIAARTPRPRARPAPPGRVPAAGGRLQRLPPLRPRQGPRPQAGRPGRGRRGDGRLLRPDGAGRPTSRSRATCPPTCRRCALDRDLFKQALLNLLLNAQQAMPDGGELTIQADARADGGVVSEPDRHRQGHDAGGGGQGVPAVLLDASRAAPAWACRRRARSSRPTAARIDVQSEVGRGTKFTLRLPATDGRLC